MLKIYFKTAIRHLSRGSIYATINIIGLATGITAMLLAILFWRDESSFDSFHERSKRLLHAAKKIIAAIRSLDFRINVEVERVHEYNSNNFYTRLTTLNFRIRFAS